MGQGEAPGSGEPGTGLATDEAEREREKARIEQLAREGVDEGLTLKECCPYSSYGWRALHFTAVFILLGGRV